MDGLNKGVQLLQCRTSVRQGLLKRATGQFHHALFNYANYRAEWTVEPFIYSHMYNFMHISLNYLTPSF